MADLLSLLNENQTTPVQEHSYMVLDVETRRSAKDVGGWHKAAQMGVSVAVLYDSADDSFTPYRQEELDLLFKRLHDAKRVVGFNISGFDYTVLQPFAPYDLKKLPTLDMLVHVKNSLSYRVSLDNIAMASLGVGKNADGMQALTWWREGRMDDIIKYCQQDVDITKQIYLYGRKHGYVLATNKGKKVMRVKVNF